MRIHICYCDRLFHPNRENRGYYWHLTSQNARHIWLALKNKYQDVTYGDEIPDEPIDVLWTNRSVTKTDKIKKMGYIASVSHHSYVAREIRKSVNIASVRPEGLYKLKDRYQYYKTYLQSDMVVYAGNDTIKKSFYFYPNIKSVDFVQFNWGLDVNHFKPTGVGKKENIFIHNCNRFSLRKGTHIVLEAWKEFVKKNRNSKLIIIGRLGDYDISKCIEKLPNIQVIYDKIPRNDDTDRQYVEYLSQAKWVILPSLAEGQAGSLLEAMSCGCIPIASLDTGINADEYFGYVVNPNTKKALCDQMEKAIVEWKEDKPLIVRDLVSKRHSWEYYENFFIDVTESMLSMRMRKKKVSKIKLLYLFCAFDILGLRHNMK